MSNIKLFNHDCDFLLPDNTCADGGCPVKNSPICCRTCDYVHCEHRCAQSAVVKEVTDA